MIAGRWPEETRLRQGSAERIQALSASVERAMQRISANAMRAHDLTEKGFVNR